MDKDSSITRLLLLLTLTPKTPADRESIVHGLQEMEQQLDPVSGEWNGAGDALTIGATDDEHLDRVVDRFRREFHVCAGTSAPRVNVRRELVDLPTGRAWVDVEPWMDVRICAPPFYVPRIRDAYPDVRFDITADRASGIVWVTSHVRLAQILGLRRAVRDSSHGHAEASVEFVRYAPRGDAEPGVLVRTHP